MLKWTTKNTHIKVVGETTPKDNSLVVAIAAGVIGLCLFILVVPKLVGLVGGAASSSGGNRISLPIFGKNEVRTNTVNNMPQDEVKTVPNY